MKIVCSTASPGEVLDYLDNNSVAGVYFLDVDLNCSIDGIRLAEAIRAHDPRGFIVFITADAKSLTLTFEYKVEAMDYILKGDFDLSERICKCLHNAYEKYTAKRTPLHNNFVIKVSKDEILSVDCSKILYFEVSSTTPHNIVVHTDSSRHQFRGKLSQIQKELHGTFFKCHRSVIVNVEKVVHIDTSLLKLRLENGTSVDVAAKHVKSVMELIRKLSAQNELHP